MRSGEARMESCMVSGNLRYVYGKLILGIVWFLLIGCCPLPCHAAPPAWSWIWAPDGYHNPETIFFRMHFRISHEPAKVRLLITADDSYTAYLNGDPRPIGRGADWTNVQEYDITSGVVVGSNLLAVETTNTGGPGGLIFQIRATYANGHTVTISSDAATLVNRRPPPRWTAADLDDSRWPHAAELAPANGGPWGVLRGAPRPDLSRLVRMWDIHTGGKSGENPYTRPRQTGERMLLSSTVPSTSEMQILASAGFSLFQFDSPYLSTELTEPGKYDFQEAQAALNATKKQGQDWCYHTHEAFPPKWYRDKVPFTRIECLEHHQPVQAFSPWEPRWDAFVDQGYAAMRAAFPKENGPSAIDVGIHGDYGDAALLDGSRVSVPVERDDWKQRFGDTHDHLGWWCGDDLAVADFRSAMLKKYGSLDAINTAWKRSFHVPAEIVYPDHPRGDARQEWLDFVTWYRDGVRRAVELNLGAAHKYFPESLLMLPAGLNSENPRGGTDNSLLPKLAAKYGAVVRSAHGGLSPFALNAATMFGRLGSACRFYSVPFWSEPPAGVTPDLEVGRIFEAVSQGAQGFFEYSPAALDSRDVFYRYGKYMTLEKPVVDVAMFYPAEAQSLRPDQGYEPLFARSCARLRDVTNFDIVDDRMVRDGCLSHYRVLALWEGTMASAETLARIKEWVSNGGVLLAYDFGKVSTFDGDTSWFTDLFGYVQELDPARVTLRYFGTLPDQYRIPLTEPESAGFLSGEWYMPETDGPISYRWTGANASVQLPLKSDRSYVVTIRALVPPAAEQLTRRVLLNDQEIGRIDSTGDVSYRFVISPESSGGRSVSVLRIQSDTFADPNDAAAATARKLGVRIQSIRVAEQGALERADAEILSGSIAPALDLRRLRDDWTRRYGKGLTIYFPANQQLIDGYINVIQRAVYQLSSLDDGRRDALPIDTGFDGVYATLFPDKILYYNPKDVAVTKTVTIPPEAFAAWKDEVTTPMETTWKLTMEPHSMSAIYFTPAPQELLLECEGFSDLGLAKKLTSPDCSPGHGQTAVRVSAAAGISTRFPVDVAGNYTIYTRCLAGNKLQPVDILMDGQPIPSVDARAGETLLSGSVNLGKGLHTLTLRPRDGKAVRADFVVLTSDPTIAGYNFAVHAAQLD